MKKIQGEDFDADLSKGVAKATEGELGNLGYTDTQKLQISVIPAAISAPRDMVLVRYQTSPPLSEAGG